MDLFRALERATCHAGGERGHFRGKSVEREQPSERERERERGRERKPGRKINSRRAAVRLKEREWFERNERNKAAETILSGRVPSYVRITRLFSRRSQMFCSAEKRGETRENKRGERVSHRVRGLNVTPANGFVPSFRRENAGKIPISRAKEGSNDRSVEEAEVNWFSLLKTTRSEMID